MNEMPSTMVDTPAADPAGGGFRDDSYWRLSVEQYHAMIDSGILVSGDPIELLEGMLVRKMTKSPRHVLVVQSLRDLLPKLLPNGYFVNDQEPVTTCDSEPEPDLMIVRGRRTDYSDRHPIGQDSPLIIDVAETSLKRDRGTKRRIYARAGVPEYWVVDLVSDKVVVFTAPVAEEGRYAEERAYGKGDAVPLIVDSKELGRIDLEQLP